MFGLTGRNSTGRLGAIMSKTIAETPAKGWFDAADVTYSLENPGSYPFTRGIHPTMYLKKTWTMRQYAGFGDAAASNARYRYLLSQGITGLSIAFDLPTQMGYDSDHALARGEVGKVGVAISSIEDMEMVLRDLPLDQVSTSMTINSTAAILLCLYLAVADKNNVPRKKVRGTVQNDLLKEYIARGTYIFPPRKASKSPPIFSISVAKRFRTGTRFPSAGIT